MKWELPGHEFDMIYNELQRKFSRMDEVIIYGGGVKGIKLHEELRLRGTRTKAFIDKKAESNHYFIDGVEVYPIRQLDEIRNHKEILLVAVGYYSTQEVVLGLRSCGLAEWEDFFVTDKVNTLFGVYEKSRLKIELVEIPLTEKCTLNCRKCSFFTPYYVNPKNIDLPEIKNELDVLFNRLDFVDDVRFLGGEPFLYPFFKEVLQYLFDCHSTQFNRVIVLTNGTLMPQEALTTYIKEKSSRFLIGITDYTAAVDYQMKLRVFKQNLEDNHINYYIDSAKSWLDLGFPEIKERKDADAAKKVFYKCGMHCRTLYDSKLWYCAFESSAFRAGIMRAVDGMDYIDLEKTENKKEIMEFIWGYSSSGYNSLCEYCKLTDYKIIPPGEQMVKLK